MRSGSRSASILPGGLLLAHELAEHAPQLRVPLDEERVGRMLGVAGLGGDLGVELHEPRHLAVVADQREEPVDAVVALVVEVRHVHFVALAEDLLEELLLRREVVQEARLAEPDGIGELAHRGAPIPVAGDHVERGGEDLLALRDALRVRTPACHT